MSLSRGLNALKKHPGIAHSAFVSIIMPAVAGGIALVHASSDPIYLNKLNFQWEAYQAHIDSKLN